MTYKPEGLAEVIFKDRYTIHPDESWTDASWRVSEHIAQAETDKYRIPVQSCYR